MSEPEAPESATLRRAFAALVFLTFGVVSFLAAFCSRKAEEPGKAAGSAASAPVTPPPPPPFVPFNAKVDATGRLWILDSVNNRLNHSTEGSAPQQAWGGLGEENTSFRQPEGLAVSGETLYVADTWNHRVSKFGLDGQWKASVRDFMGPRAVAIGNDGSVWVSDTGNHRVMRYDADLKNGKPIGIEGTETGKFKSPVGIAVGPSGTVYVADTGNRRIQAFDADGKYLRSWPVPFFEKTWLVHLESDAGETIYVSNPDGGEVISFGKTGEAGKSWKKADSGEAFLRPTGLGLDRKNGVLYVADAAANRVFKIQVSGAATR